MNVKLSLVLGAVLWCSSSASADVLIFDDLGLADRGPVSDQYIDRGVIFSDRDGAVLRIADATGPVFPGDPQGLFADDGTSVSFQGPIVATFLMPVVSAGAWIDLGQGYEGVKIEAYSGPDGTGALLGTASTRLETLLMVQADAIRSVVFSQVEPRLGWSGTTYLIDHFTFEVPEPAGLAVLAAVWPGRRRRR